MPQYIIKKEATIPCMAEPITSQFTNDYAPESIPSYNSAVPSDDVFASMGNWLDHAKENNVKASKKRINIRRLRDVVDSDDEWKEPTITSVNLVPNPFCISTSSSSSVSSNSDSDSKSDSKKSKRVCFNPSITFHYYEPHNNN
ncbi:hypothetical protein CAEBREN_11847 [Caenorhabditis brenneri]|uniref:Uncharacterized protein n=1 Tax=Caenorhabditis brenneri TaxID=135651 RepID=G0PGY8_CAEBE|nr:hypothetical protein CAEBREN_11847 [Caenorhabditis brenneri]